MNFIKFFVRKEPAMSGALFYLFFVMIFLVIFSTLGYSLFMSLFYSLFAVTSICVLVVFILILYSTIKIIAETIIQRYREWRIQDKQN